MNNYDKGNYANVETQQRSFYVDTLLYILKHYEEEISYKLLLSDEFQSGYCFKFNVNGILRADFAIQMEGLSKGVNNAIYTPNEAREFVDLPRKKGGDELMCNGNYIPLTSVGKGVREMDWLKIKNQAEDTPSLYFMVILSLLGGALGMMKINTLIM